MNAIIIEDNPRAANVLLSYIKEYPHAIDVKGVAGSFEEGIQLIRDVKADVWFLDIQLEEKTVFELLDQVDEHIVSAAAIIFITAYYQADYLHEALRKSAIDYVTKPIDKNELFAAIDKAIERTQNVDLQTRMANLENHVRDIHVQTGNQKFPIHKVDGSIDYVDSRNILCINTEDQITRILTTNGSVATARALKFYTQLTEPNNSFYRISKQAIVNLEHMSSYHHKDRLLTLSDGSTLGVSRRRAGRLLDVGS